MSDANSSNNWESIEVFPQNRTLYVDQFTEFGPVNNQECVIHQVGSIEKAFQLFKPDMDIELCNEDGTSIIEHFAIASLEDFIDDNLILQSDHLTAIESKIAICDSIIRQLERNKALRNTINEDGGFQNLKSTLRAIIVDLQKIKLTEVDNSISNFSSNSFSLLKSIVRGLENLDPEHKAKKEIFLNDIFFKEDRCRIELELTLWSNLFETFGANIEKAIDACKKFRDEATTNLQRNLSIIHESLAPLEITYRTLECFYANAGTEEISCLYLLNVRKKNLLVDDSDDEQAIKKELEKYYDRLDLKASYSLLVIPGYLGNVSNIRKWASIAFKNKVILVTDFEDSKSFTELKNSLEQAKLQGQDLCLANVVMTCNYILGRKMSGLANETDDLYIPGSGALAGRMANTDAVHIAQGVVGEEYGVLDNLKSVRIGLLRSEIAVLVDFGTIPIAEMDGRVMALSNQSLYNGSAISHHEYPIVRVFDWIKKVLMNYMHEIALETWDSYKSSQQLKDKIQGFLNHYQGYQYLFSDYKLGTPIQNPDTKIVIVDISITPFYIGKNFLIKLTADEKKNQIEADTEIAS